MATAEKTEPTIAGGDYLIKFLLGTAVTTTTTAVVGEQTGSRRRRRWWRYCGPAAAMIWTLGQRRYG